MSDRAPVGDAARRFALVVAMHPTQGWVQLLYADGTHGPVGRPAPGLSVKPGDVLELGGGWRVTDEKLARFVRRELFPWY